MSFVKPVFFPRTIKIDEFIRFILKYMDNWHFLGDHSRNVSDICLKIADRLGISGKDKEFLRYAALLHDIGKLYMPKEILFAPRRLTKNEFEIIKEHPRKGYELVKDIPALKYINIFILYHHHRHGNGYPKEIELPVDSILLDILTVADSYCAIEEKRIYSEYKKMYGNKAVNILKNSNDEKNKGINLSIVEVLESIKT